MLAAGAEPASLEGPSTGPQQALPQVTPAHLASPGGQLIAAEPDGAATPHGRAVIALTYAVDCQPEAALRTLRLWLKDGASEEAVT
jgi:hypothetical protein